MSEENLQKPAEPSVEKDVSTSVLEDGNIEVTINKGTKEFSLKDPATGKVVTFKANIIEPEEESEDELDEEDEPLSPEEFQDALQRIDSLGLTWTADRALQVKPKNPESEDALYSEEFEDVQAEYPGLPRELTAIVYHVLTGREAPEVIVGNESDLKKKIVTVRELVITPEFRSEFFFKQAIKVPYFETVDWEVVLKTHERNVEDTPGAAYALLLLTFHNTNPRVGKLDEHENKTVAVDINLVNQLIRIFVDIKTALEEAQRWTKIFNERHSSEDKDDASKIQN